MLIFETGLIQSFSCFLAWLLVIFENFRVMLIFEKVLLIIAQVRYFWWSFICKLAPVSVLNPWSEWVPLYIFSVKWKCIFFFAFSQVLFLLRWYVLLEQFSLYSQLDLVRSFAIVSFCRWNRRHWSHDGLWQYCCHSQKVLSAQFLERLLHIQLQCEYLFDLIF